MFFPQRVFQFEALACCPMAPRSAIAMVRVLAATNAILALVVVLLLRQLRRKAQSLNVFIEEVGQARSSTNAAAWTLKLV